MEDVCNVKSNVRLKSNVIDSSKKTLRDYLPFDLLPASYNDTRVNLTKYQLNERIKKLFYANKFIIANKKCYNSNQCKNCKYKDMCF